MNNTLANEQRQRRPFPKGLMIAAFLMIIFGLAEILTSFTHKFFGLTSSLVTNSTITGTTIGTFYFVSGLFVLTKKKWAVTPAILLLIADAIGRISMVLTGYYPMNSALQTFEIITGTTIVIFFAFYIRLKRKFFK